MTEQDARKISEGIYEASNTLWLVVDHLKKIGKFKAAELVEKAAVAVPLEVAENFRIKAQEIAADEAALHTGYQFEPYDVLQIEKYGEWQDFATLRTEDDARYAVQAAEGKHNEFYGKFRIISENRKVVKLAKEQNA